MSQPNRCFRLSRKTKPKYKDIFYTSIRAKCCLYSGTEWYVTFSTLLNSIQAKSCLHPGTRVGMYQAGVKSRQGDSIFTPSQTANSPRRASTDTKLPGFSVGTLGPIYYQVHPWFDSARFALLDDMCVLTSLPGGKRCAVRTVPGFLGVAVIGVLGKMYYTARIIILKQNRNTSTRATYTHQEHSLKAQNNDNNHNDEQKHNNDGVNQSINQSINHIHQSHQSNQSINHSLQSCKYGVLDIKSIVT